MVLVLASVLVGAKVISSANSTARMWSASRDLAAGSVITRDDLAPVAVRLPGSAGGYLPTDQVVAGMTISRAVAAGELIPRSAVSATPPATTITVPLDSEDAPKVQRGQRVVLWLSTKTCRAVPILADVTVQDVQSGAGGAFRSGATQSVVIRVPSALASRVVTALAQDGAVVRAGILDGAAADNANADLPSLDACLSSSR